MLPKTICRLEDIMRLSLCYVQTTVYIHVYVHAPTSVTTCAGAQLFAKSIIFYNARAEVKSNDKRCCEFSYRHAGLHCMALDGKLWFPFHYTHLRQNYFNTASFFLDRCKNTKRGHKNRHAFSAFHSRKSEKTICIGGLYATSRYQEIII